MLSPKKVKQKMSKGNTNVKASEVLSKLEPLDLRRWSLV